MNTPAVDDTGIRQLDQLLTRYIGPMGRIVLGRACRKAHDDWELVRVLATNIDSEAERAAFVAAANIIVVKHRVIDLSRPAENAAEPARPPATPAPPAPTSNRPEPPRPAPAPAPARPAEPIADTGAMKAGAIFISYARDDLPAAKRIAQGIREAGLDVWLDFGRLQAGDVWDLKIRRNIEACSFFLALISQTTDARQEGYFRREWNIAADRALNFADDVPFILPVTIDDTQAYTARVPERFKRAHWIRLPAGEVTEELIDQLKTLMAGYQASR